MSEAHITRRRLIGGAAAGAAVASVPAAAQGRSAAAERTRRSGPRIRRADVVVVGAGFAGLTAAREVVRGGRSALVLEARDRVGGRVQNRRIGRGEISEVGGEFVGPTQDRILALAREVGVKTFPTYDEGLNVFYTKRGRSTFSDKGPLGAAPPDPTLASDIATVVTRLDMMSEEVPVDAPWRAPNAAEYDGQTLETFLRRNSVNPEFRTLAAAALEAIFGAEARDISLLFALFYIAASGNERHKGTFERNFNTRGGAQERRFVGGSQVVAERVAHALGRRIELGTAVRRIANTRHGVRVESDGVIAYGRRVIVAIPPTLAGRILYDPRLPARREQLTQRTPQGTLIKCEAVYDRPFWRQDGLTGQAISEIGPLKVTFDNSPPDGSPGVLVGFVGGHEARVWGPRPAAERRRAVLRNLANYFGPKALHPREYFEKDWSRELWTRGCPVAVLPPGVLLDYGPALRAPVGRIHWAGTETAGYWNGYMDGAVRSGERAAREVLAEI